MIRIMPVSFDAPTKKATVVNVTSRSPTNGKYLSPFLLGPVQLYAGHVSMNVENAWQYTKVYPQHMSDAGWPTEEYWIWAKAGWASSRANRYLMGKGVKPAGSWWNGKLLSYVEARKRIYIPLYSQAVLESTHWIALKNLYQWSKVEGKDLWLIDFDVPRPTEQGYAWAEVVNDEKNKMGHAFVLAMMLEGIDLKDICL